MLLAITRLAFFKEINGLGYIIVQISEFWSQTMEGLKFQKFTLIVTAEVGGFRGQQQRQMAKILNEHRNSSVRGVLKYTATAREIILNSRKCTENNPRFNLESSIDFPKLNFVYFLHLKTFQ
jgi:hypothetical protein